MGWVKRDYCLMFAKEDCRRQSAQEASISSVVLGAATAEAVEFARILAQRAPKSGPAGYLRTSDAWTRRASAVRLSVLESIRSMLVSDEPDPNVIDVSDLRVPDARDIVLTENAYTDHAVANGDANTQISIAMKQNPSNARSEVSVAHSTAHIELSNGQPHPATPRATAMPPLADARSEVSVARPSRPADARSEVSVARPSGPADARSEVSVARPSGPSDARSGVSVAPVSQNVTRAMILQSEEDAIKTWYDAAATELNSKQTRGELREEQFKRKKALLRAEYWTKMDKMRNNGSPTVIDA